MKKIILCSDGTGNSGGDVNSNVWRLYEAIDVRVPEQVIFYDDGVGTQENKFIRALSSGTGIGVRQNVIDLYSYLLHQYDPGDQIYLFGFSRGAFTARVLSNLLFYCGIAKAINDQDVRKTPQEIAELAEQAVSAYEAREFCDPRQGKPAQFRRDFGWRHELNVEQEPGWFPLHFVGVWDTVEAYGLPVDEMANALTMLGGFKLRFKEQGGLRENDLHPLLSNGFHAIATDDERHSFHPILWIENPPYDPESATGERIPGWEQVMSIGRNPNRNIRQVWFAGMHSNVGGGYPQDQMAHVSLLWMIEMATNCGLVFDPTLVELYQQIADSDGRMYDSRSGLAVYFRYRPRDLRVLCASAGLEQPTLHISVFRRLQRHVQDYAPTGIPAAYLIDPPHLPSGEVNPDARIALHDHVDELIWRRRILYYVFVGGTLHFLGWLWCFAKHPTPLDTESWCCAKLFVYYFFQPIMNTVEWFIPEYFKPGWKELGHRPWWVLGFVASFGFVYWRSVRLTKGISALSNEGWTEGFRPPPTPPLTATTRLRPPPRFKSFRTRYAACASKFQQQVVPVLFIVALFVGAATLIYRWFEPLFTGTKPSSSSVQPTVQQLVAKFEFDTANPLFSSPISVEAGKKYRVEVDPHPEPGVTDPKAPWFDRLSPASPDGVLKPDSFVFRFGNFAKRAPAEPWFKVMASIGPDDQELIPVGSGRDITPKTSGRLFLFVNDVPCFYGNNHGKATVTVAQVQ